MRDGDNIWDVVAAGADWIGMIFWPKSPRYVRMIPTGYGIIPDLSPLGGECPGTAFRRVGVFVDDTAQNIITHVVNYHLDIIQLHGDESPTFIRNLRATLDPDIRPGIKFIKAVSIGSAEDARGYLGYEDCADYFLFDTRCACVGGSGRQFDWSILDAYDGQTPFLLSGGIGPDDGERIAGIDHPLFAGIDLNSRFETEPGMKDVEMLRKFIRATASRKSIGANPTNQTHLPSRHGEPEEAKSK